MTESYDCPECGGEFCPTHTEAGRDVFECADCGLIMPENTQPRRVEP